MGSSQWDMERKHRANWGRFKVWQHRQSPLSILHTNCNIAWAPSDQLLHSLDSRFDKKTIGANVTVRTHTLKMKTSVIFQLKCPSKLARLPPGITHNFCSLETLTGRSCDHILQLEPDDGMTMWTHALGIPLCTLSRKGFQSLLSGRRCITLQWHSK